MTQHLTQAWVTRVTSENTADVIASGRELARLPTDAEIAAILSTASRTDAVKEMVRRRWFVPTPSNDRDAERGRALQAFLFSHQQTRPAFAAAAMFRRQPRQGDLLTEMTTLAWLCRVYDKASASTALQFDLAALNKDVIRHLARLSKNDSGPRDAINYLRRLGICVVIESSLPGMRTDGASFVARDVGPVIALTLRYDRIDSFWFTLLHELAHIVLHLMEHSDRVFVDTIDEDDRIEQESELEAEADAFAKDSFVPRDAWLRSEAFRRGTEAAVVALANTFRIHPAIVAGRLRFERKDFQAFTQMLGIGDVRRVLMSD